MCVLYVVCDDSLVENGQQTSYEPCGVGAVGGNGVKEVCNTACGGAVSCCCACISAHDALAAMYAAQFACVAVDRLMALRRACEFRTGNTIRWGKLVILGSVLLSF